MTRALAVATFPDQRPVAENNRERAAVRFLTAFPYAAEIRSANLSSRPEGVVFYWQGHHLLAGYDKTMELPANLVGDPFETPVSRLVTRMIH